MRSVVATASLVLFGIPAVGFPQDDQPLLLKKALLDDQITDAWIYEDIEAGYAKARETGRPLLVSFRCVP